MVYFLFLCIIGWSTVIESSRFGAAWLGKRELTDRQVVGFFFPQFLENTEKTKAS